MDKEEEAKEHEEKEKKVEKKDKEATKKKQKRNVIIKPINSRSKGREKEREKVFQKE